MKKASLLLALTFCVKLIFAQAHFGLGMSIISGKSKNQESIDSFGYKIDNNRTTFGLGISETFKINTFKFKTSTPSSIALCVPASFGFSNDIYDNFHLYTDLALVAQFQLGNLATSDADYGNGIYCGLGFGLTRTTWNPIVEGTNSVSIEDKVTLGPILEFGVRTGGKKNEVVGDIRFSVRPGTDLEGKPLIFSCTISTYFLKFDN